MRILPQVVLAICSVITINGCQRGNGAVDLKARADASAAIETAQAAKREAEVALQAAEAAAKTAEAANAEARLALSTAKAQPAPTPVKPSPTIAGVWEWDESRAFEIHSVRDIHGKGEITPFTLYIHTDGGILIQPKSGEVFPEYGYFKWTAAKDGRFSVKLAKENEQKVQPGFLEMLSMFPIVLRLQGENTLWAEISPNRNEWGEMKGFGTFILNRKLSQE